MNKRLIRIILKKNYHIKLSSIPFHITVHNKDEIAKMVENYNNIYKYQPALLTIIIKI